MKSKFYIVVVHINADMLVEFHFNSCESSRDMEFSAHSLEAVSVNCCSIEVCLVTFALENDVHFTVAISSV